MGSKKNAASTKSRKWCWSPISMARAYWVKDTPCLFKWCSKFLWPQLTTKKKNKSLISARKCSGPFTDYKSVWNHAIYGPSDTLWLCQKFAIENGPVEIVDFPINSMVIFRYVNVYQRLMLIFISPSKNITATYFANFHHPPLSSHSNHLKNHWLFNIAMV